MASIDRILRLSMSRFLRKAAVAMTTSQQKAPVMRSPQRKRKKNRKSILTKVAKMRRTTLSRKKEKKNKRKEKLRMRILKCSKTNHILKINRRSHMRNHLNQCLKAKVRAAEGLVSSKDQYNPQRQVLIDLHCQNARFAQRK